MRKDDEVQVDCKPLLRAVPQVQRALHKEDEAQVDCYLPLQNYATKILPSGEQTSHSGA